MLEYSCSNCKHVTSAKHGYSGLTCGRITSASNFGDGKSIYLVSQNGSYAAMCVKESFLCVLYEPKE